MSRILGLTGTVVEDTIETAGGPVVEDFGGARYAIAAARALLPADVELAPVLAVGSDAWERVRADLASLPGVRTDGLVRSPAVNNKVRLVYRSADERDETLTGGVPPLGWADLEPWVDRLEAWLWNFVAGGETDLATFRRVVAAFRGPIHLDVHSLCLEPPGGGPRRPRRPADWEAWVGGVRWVQVNDREAGLLWHGDYAPMPAASEAALAERVAALGVEGLLVTRGPRGASWLPATGEPVHLPAHSPEAAVDPTGCGDVLGAAWFALRAGRGMDPAAALAGAVRAAGLAAATRGSAALYSTQMAEGGPTP